MNILIIDDDRITLSVNEILVRKTAPESSIIAMNSGLFALEYLKSHEDNWPEVILLDINMPIMNGWEFLDSLENQMSKCGCNTIICMLSSSRHNEDISQYNARKYVKSYLQKPLQINELENVLSQID